MSKACKPVSQVLLLLLIERKQMHHQCKTSLQALSYINAALCSNTAGRGGE